MDICNCIERSIVDPGGSIHGISILHTMEKIIKMLIDDRWQRIINAHE
jgi:hypothetical protein